MAYKPTIDLNNIKANVATFILAVLQQTAQANPFAVQYAWGQVAKPLWPYALFKVMGPRKIGSRDEVRVEFATNNQGVIVTDNEGDPVFGGRFSEGEREFTVSIECCSNDEAGPNLANTLMAALDVPQYASILEGAGLYAVRVIHPIMDVTLPMADSTQFERKAVLDFYLTAVSSMCFEPGEITTVSGEVEAAQDGGTPLEIPLTVTPD